MASTPVTPGTHSYVAQQVIAFCAAYVDSNFDPKATPMINTDELIAAACGQFGITGREFQEAYELREGYADNMAFQKRANNWVRK
jgi:hypothetical protein